MGISIKKLPKALQKKIKKIQSPGMPVRVNSLGEFGSNMPELALIIMDKYRTQSRGSISFCVNELPKSVNHNQGFNGKRKFLVPQVYKFRELVAMAIGAQKLTWKPKGPVAALMFFESPTWITQKREVREMDCDNRVKPMFDAVQRATGMPDELVWEFHAFKVASKKTRTTMFLFDMGDVVNFYT